MAPRKHAALIHAFADGAEIEFRDVTGAWRPDKQPLFLDDCEYRLKPAAPAYPQTTMTPREFADVLDPLCITLHNWKLAYAIANAALRHAIDTGLVAPKEAYDQVNTALAEAERRLGSCEARELAIVDAVTRACENQAAGSLPLRPVFMIDPHAIIASVP